MAEKTYRLNLHKKNTCDLIELGYLLKSAVRPLEDDASKSEVIDKINEIVYHVDLMWKFESRHIGFEASMVENLYRKDEEVAVDMAKREQQKMVRS